LHVNLLPWQIPRGAPLDALHRDRTRRVDTAGHSESVTSISVLSRVLCASPGGEHRARLNVHGSIHAVVPDKRKRRGRAVTGRAMTYELPGSLCRFEYRLNWGTRAIKGATECRSADIAIYHRSTYHQEREANQIR